MNTVEDTGKWYSKRQAGELLAGAVRYEALYQQQGKCYICGVEEWKTKARFDAHRIVPGKYGGKYTTDNVVLVCRRCHHSIEGMTAEEIESVRGSRSPSA